MEAVLVDVYLAGNLGDDLFLDTLATNLNPIVFSPFYPGQKYKVFFSKYKNLRPMSYSFLDKIKTRLGRGKLTDFVQMAKQYDSLVFIGGGIFREGSYWETVYDYRLRIIRAFRDQKKRIFFIGCNFGPYQSNEFVNRYRSLFTLCDYIIFRDKKSFDLFKDMDNVEYAPDILWSYDVPEVSSKAGLVGVSTIDPRHKEGQEATFEGYLNALSSFCMKQLDLGNKVRLFSFCEKEGDEQVAREIAKTSPNDIEIFTYTKDIPNYLRRMGECEYFVASRFHAVVLAAKFRMKMIPIIYEDKTRNLLNDIQYSGTLITLQNIEELNSCEFWSLNEVRLKELEAKSERQMTFLKEQYL